MIAIDIRQGHVLEVLAQMPADSIDCVVTSPPYWGLRDYKIPAQVWGGEPSCKHQFALQHVERFDGGFCRHCAAWRGDFGLEPTPELYLEHAVLIFRAVRRVLKPTGTLWINIGDSYAGNRGCQVPDNKRGDVGNSRGMTVGQGELRLRDDKRGYRGDQLANGRGDQPAVLRQKTRATRDGSHAGKHTAMAALGAMEQPNRAPIPGLKPKDMVCIPWRLGLALQADGWYLRQDIIWSKSNPMPESVRDRCTKAHEYLLLLAKSERYYFDYGAIQEESTTKDPRRPYTSEGTWQMDGRPPEQRHGGELHGPKKVGGWAAGPGDHSTIGHAQEQPDRALKLQPGVNPKAQRNGAGGKQNASFSAAVKDLVDKRNKRSVWEIATEPYPEAHYATFPQELVKPCILAGCPAGGTVLDPFAGSGTTLLVAEALNCNAIGIELGAQSVLLATKRVAQSGIAFTE